MKVFFLAAGQGTRLRPITNHTPKCLVPVAGRPLIDYWFDLFERYEIEEILINTSHLSEEVEAFISNQYRSFSIIQSHEARLLGSGGTIKKNWNFVKNEKIFFVFYADNLTNINLKKMISFHKDKKKDFTLALFNTPSPKECGIVELNKDSTLISFTEKPVIPASDLAFSGIMLSNTKLINYFPDRDVFDLACDVLPAIVENSAGYVIEDYLMDIGTPENLKQAEEDIKNNLCN